MSARRNDDHTSAEPPKAKSPNSEAPEKDDRSFIQLEHKKGVASAAPVSRSRIVAGVLAAVCIALIVVSLGFVHTGSGEAWSLAWITESLGFGSPSVASVRANGVAGDTGASGARESEKSKKDGAGSTDKKDGDDSKSKKASKDEKDSKDDKEDSEGKNGDPQETPNGDDSASAQGGTGSGAAMGGAASNTAGSSAASSNGGESGGGSSNNPGSSSGSKSDGLISITVSVTSSAVGNPVSAGGTYSFQEGATVYDALCALGLSVNAHGTQYGTYVAAIGGLAEKEHGGTSGWMYSVNGVTPNTACSNYVLSNGDKVVWYYVTG